MTTTNTTSTAPPSRALSRRLISGEVTRTVGRSVRVGSSAHEYAGGLWGPLTCVTLASGMPPKTRWIHPTRGREVYALPSSRPLTTQRPPCNGLVNSGLPEDTAAHFGRDGYHRMVPRHLFSGHYSTAISEQKVSIW